MESVSQLSAGDLQVWVEQNQSICLKATTRFGDAVELSVDEADQLITILQEMILSIHK
jgi:hypothetical protein